MGVSGVVWGIAKGVEIQVWGTGLCRLEPEVGFKKSTLAVAAAIRQE